MFVFIDNDDDNGGDRGLCSGGYEGNISDYSLDSVKFQQTEAGLDLDIFSVL